jgi:hypothetical protein
MRAGHYYLFVTLFTTKSHKLRFFIGYPDNFGTGAAKFKSNGALQIPIASIPPVPIAPMRAYRGPSSNCHFAV